MNTNLINEIKSYFPIFKNKKNGNKLHYLDNAALTQVPFVVINSLNYYYSEINANTHRGVYFLSEIATEHLDNVRIKISKFIGATHPSECIFVKNTTEGINLVANSFLRNILKENDEIIISNIEHHSNIIPWYLLSKEFNAKLKIIPLLESGDLDYIKFNSLLTNKTKFIAINHISNSLGTINDLEYLIKIANLKNIPILVDGAQSILNTFINVKKLNCDFFVFSSHKMFGPIGIGILYIKKKFLNIMSPYQSGGSMVKYLDFDNIIWNDPPYKFEAGTLSIGNIIAFGSTIDFLNSLNLNTLFLYKKDLLILAKEKLSKISNLRFIGNPKMQASLFSFVLDNIHPHDIGTICNYYGVSVRAGHHCCLPVMQFFGLSSTVRVSLSIYNTEEDIDILVKSINQAKNIFNK